MDLRYSPEDPIMQGKSWVSIDREGVAGEHREAGLCLPMLLRGPLEPQVVAGKQTHCSREAQFPVPSSANVKPVVIPV